MDEEKGKPKGGGLFIMGVGDNIKPYPAWRYHDFNEPILVNDEKEDKQAEARGWIAPESKVTSVDHLSNWRHDLEDMTAKQLVLFAKEEFGVDLPVEAGDVRLVKAMWRLTHIAPQHSGRICLLAQSVELDYDKTVAEIYGLAEDFEFTVTKEMTI